MRPRTVAVIQARMGSSRLPGKVLRPLGRTTVLGVLLARVARARFVDQIVVATTTAHRDDRIVDECRRLGVAHLRGSEPDVLDRYYRAGMLFRAGIVVRITADNPFTDPDAIDHTVEQVWRWKADYAIETDLPVGVTAEALSWPALSEIHAVALLPRWREHVTLYAKENPDLLRTSLLRAAADVRRPDLSFTVDTAADLRWVDDVYTEIGRTDFTLKELIATADEVRVGHNIPVLRAVPPGLLNEPAGSLGGVSA